MAIIGLVLSIFGLGTICWLLFSLAVYALPFFVGMTIAFAAFHGGSGVVIAFAAGALAAGITLAVGRIAFTAVRPPFIRAIIGLLYAVPAALAGYHLSYGLGGFSMTDEGWRAAFAFVGAGLIGVTAFSRMALVATPGGPGGALGASAYSPLWSRQREQTRV
ncbi:MAG: hypothetical protein ISP45_00360 [Reyranella sp.]|jgi:hypothetical protein|nr:hypothetical protein [Reyranella sp.]